MQHWNPVTIAICAALALLTGCAPSSVVPPGAPSFAVEPGVPGEGLHFGLIGGPPATHYVRLRPGVSEGCPAFKRDVRVENTHAARIIKVTYQFRGGSGGREILTRRLAPGETHTITPCNFGGVELVQARYVR